ncbi:MAG: sensor histidine kinase [Actinomycetota bacterium]
MQTSHARASERVTPAVERTVDSLMLEERTKWAMHIHDALTQSVTSAVLELQTLRHRIETEPGVALAALKEVEDAIRNDLKEIREVLFELEQGEVREEPSFATFISDLVERWKLTARISVEGDFDTVPEAILETAHAIVSEALANAAKHSGTPDVTVKVIADEEMLRIEIEDRGRGIVAVTDDDPHFGLKLLRARTEQLEGSIRFESTPGSGMRVVASLPVGGRGELG